jgi:succinylglutamate desuccinylase
MTSPEASLGGESRGEDERVIGHLRGDSAGPTLIIVGSIHGNEDAGTAAAQRVFAHLQKQSLQGEVLALIGNMAGRKLDVRYQVKDLNRQWTPEIVNGLAGRMPELDDAEDAEQRALLHHIENAIAHARGKVFLIDLHTTSAAGFPFVLFGNIPAQRAFASQLPITNLLGMEERVNGVLSKYMTTRGVTTCAVEGGQHRDPRATDYLEAAIWVALTSSGVMPASVNPRLTHAVALLDKARGSIPRAIKVTRRYAITPDCQFRMEKGFANIAFVKEGTLLAHDHTGEILAPKDGFVMLPLYQGLGSEGFFWGYEVTSR